MSIAAKFLATAERLPDKTFLVDPAQRSFSYAQMLSRARRFATLLESRDVKPGNRVILKFPNSADYFCAYLGCLLHGCTALLLDHRSRAQHLDYVRTDADVSLWVSPRIEAEEGSIPNGLAFPAELEDFPEMPREKLLAMDNPLALIIYTSGTTGMPKGVKLTHASLSHTIEAITSWAQIEESDRELTTLSLTHLFGCAHVHIYWSLGGTVYIEEKLGDIPRLLEKISREKITSFPGTPAGFKMILDNFADDFRKHASRLKYIVINSAPMDPEYTRRLLDLLPNTRIYMYYGLTEASRSSYICYNDHPDKLASVGRASPGAAVCIGSPEKPLVEQAGEILVRGPHVTKGYWGMDSSEYFIDEWFKTGDLGILDQDGFLTWKGRTKEQINIDGLKVSPTEIENVLREHPQVIDCAAVGTADSLSGERVVAFVVAEGETGRELELALRRFCKKALETYKIPRKIFFVDEIPRTDSGKTKRLALKEKLF